MLQSLLTMLNSIFLALHLQDPCGSLLRLNLFIDDASRLNQDRQTMEEIRKILLEEKEKIDKNFKF